MNIMSVWYGGSATLALAAAFVATAPAYAQNAPTASGGTAAGAAGPVALDAGDIVVTAQKRTQRLQDVPMAITALSTQNFTAQGIDRIQDYLSQVPGLGAYSGSSGQVTVAIRGVTTGGHNNPTVGITIDDIPLGSSIRGTYGDLLVPELDPAILQQIEVLRGPQGTLYGAASLGGLIRYVTVQPKFDVFSGRVEVGGSSVAHGGTGFSTRASLNVPIASNLAASISGFFRRDPGFVDNFNLGQNNVDRLDTYGGRVAILWAPTDSIKVKLGAIINRTHATGVSDIDANYDAAAGTFTPQRPYGQSRIAGTGPYWKNLQFYTAEVDADLKFATLTSETVYEKNGYKRYVDGDILNGAGTRAVFGAGTGGLIIFQAPSDKISQEIRLTSKSGQKFEWLIGAFYNHETGSPKSDKFAANLATGQVVGTYAIDHFPTNFTEYAGFLNATYHFSSQFDLTAGYRYSWNHSDRYEIQTGPGNPFFSTVGINGYAFTSKSNDGASTFAVSPTFKVSRNLTTYLRFSTGYRPGGPQALPNILPNGTNLGGLGAAYKPDKTKNYEGGIKGSFLDHLISFDASVYWIDWRNIQLQLKDAPTNQNYLTNAGRAVSKGVEASVTVRPAKGTTISGNFSYNDATLREDLPALPGAPKRGQRLPFAPKYAGSILADQEFALNDTLTASIGATYNYVGSRFNNITALGTQLMPKYDTFDLRAGLGTMSGLRLSLYVQNVTDKLGILAADARSTTATNPFSKVFALTTIRPRTFGVSLSKTF